MHDCILSTSKSINQDDSLLNCRINGLNNKKPDLFIIDLKLKLKKNLLLNKYLKVRKTFLITNKTNYKKTLAYKKLGFKIILAFVEIFSIVLAALFIFKFPNSGALTNSIVNFCEL